MSVCAFILFLGFATYIVLPLLVVLLILFVIKIISGSYIIKINPNISIKKQHKKQTQKDNIIDVDYTEIK